jgi:small subunit ribosomal protein S2
MVTPETLTKEQTKEVEKLFEMGAHLGHKKNRLHPRARKFVYKIVNGGSIIDLTQTVKMLAEAKRMLNQYGKENKVVLTVVTKKVANQFTVEYCSEHNVPFIASKWMSGLITNFETIIKNVKKLKTLREQRENGEWDKYVKHERMKLDKEIVKLDKLYGGLVEMMQRPDVIICVDTRKEKNAVIEARRNNIPVIAIVDTNSNPDEVLPVVMNDDSPELVQYVLKQMIDAYVQGRDSANKEEAKDSSKKAEAAPKAEPAAEEKPAEPQTEKKKTRKTRSKKTE